MSELRPLTGDQQERLATWRALALQRMGYFASILFAMKAYDAPGLGTFAVDKQWRLYIDFDFVTQAGWSDDMCGQVLLHECGHLFGKHAQRAEAVGARTPLELRTHNIAGDCSINDDLDEAGCAEVVEFGVTPGKMNLPAHETVEFYYEKLRGEAGQRGDCGTCGAPKSQQNNGSSGQPGPNGEPEDGHGSCPECGADVIFVGCGSGAGGQAAPCEVAGEGSSTPGLSEAEKEVSILSTSAHIEQAAKRRGNVPAGLVRQAALNLAPPVVPWQRVLAVAIRRGARMRKGDEDVSWSKRNRRRHNATMMDRDGVARRVIYPENVSPTPRVVVVRDTSGSMSPADLARVGSEIVGISTKVGVSGKDLLVLDVDAAVYAPVPFRNARTLTKIEGGGGTDMRVGINAAHEMSPRPNVCVVLTDGYCPWDMPRPAGMNVIVGIVGATQLEAEKFGCPDWMRVVGIPLGDPKK